MSTAAAAYAERQGWRTFHTIRLGAILVGIAVLGISLPRTGGQLGFVGQRTVLAWVAIAVLMAAFAAVAGHGVTGLWRGVLIDDHHRIGLEDRTSAFTSLPPVDEAVVSLLAISHAGYLAKKAFVSAPTESKP